jgi:hypothetical protein
MLSKLRCLNARDPQRPLICRLETVGEHRADDAFEPDSVDQVVSNWLAVPLHVVVVCVNHFVDQSFRRYGKVYIIHPLSRAGEMLGGMSKRGGA